MARITTRIVWGAGEGHTRNHAYLVHDSVPAVDGYRLRALCGTTRSAAIDPQPGKHLLRCQHCTRIARQWITTGQATTAEGDYSAIEWGVRHAAALDRTTHVDPRASYDDADHYRHALLWCGNTDATVVQRVPGGDWHELTDEQAEARAIARAMARAMARSIPESMVAEAMRVQRALGEEARP